MQQPYLKHVLGIIEGLAHVALWHCKNTITMI